MYCSRCGEDNPAGVQACMVCGAPLGLVPPRAPKPPSAAEARAVSGFDHTMPPEPMAGPGPEGEGGTEGEGTEGEGEGGEAAEGDALPQVSLPPPPLPGAPAPRAVSGFELTAESEKTPDTVGGLYHLESVLGEGGMGRVFLGRHHLTGQHVAIKSLPPKYSRRKDLRERFVGEAQALARLDHENIVKMLTLLEDDDRFYLVLEYVPGEDLDELIDREGQLPIKQAVGLAGQVLGALEHAHERGVVHRDVKPGNIRIRSDGQAKLTDLGVAKLAHAARMTRFGCIVGTLHYMAPEQLRGEEVDHRSDIYAAGATFYEMLSGAVPYDAETDLALRNAQRDGPPEEVRDHRSEVPAHVAEALTKALALSPDNRFQSARDFKHALFSKPIVEEPQPEPGERTVSRAPTGRPGEARQPSGAAPAQPRSRSPRPKGTPKPPRRKAGASRKKAGAGQKPSRPKGKRRKAGKGAKPTPPPATTPAPKQAGGGGLLATAIMLVLSGLTVAVAVMLMSGPCR